MMHEVITQILGIAATVFAGLNIFQFIFFRSTKMKMEAESESAVVDTMIKKQELNSKTYEDLNSQVNAMMTQLMQMQSELTNAFRQVAVLSGKLAAETEKNERLVADLERVTAERDLYRKRLDELVNKYNHDQRTA